MVKSTSSYTPVPVKQPCRSLRAGFSGIICPNTHCTPQMTPVDAELSVVSPLGIYTKSHTKTQGFVSSVPTCEHLELRNTVFEGQALSLATPAGRDCLPCPKSSAQMLQPPPSCQKSEKGIRENRRDRLFGGFLGETSADEV